MSTYLISAFTSLAIWIGTAHSALAASALEKISFYSGIGAIVGLAEPCGFAIDETKLFAAIEKKASPEAEDLATINMMIEAAKYRLSEMSGLQRRTECFAARKAAENLGVLK